MLTLAQAIAYNKTKHKTQQQDARTIKRWYAKGYYLKEDASIGLYRWYITVGGKEFVKYYTGS